MAALTKERKTNSREGRLLSLAMGAGAKVFAGGLVVLGADGYAKAGATALSLIAAGIAQETVDNTAGADGDVSVEVRMGVHGLVAAAGLTIASLGKTVYIVDDQTVAATDDGGKRSAAGTLVDLDGTVAWVRIGF